MPNKRYGVIVASPPWDIESDDPAYRPLKLMQIKALPIPFITADEAVLFLAAPSSLLPHALEVMQTWGFNFVAKLSRVEFDTPLPPPKNTAWKQGWWATGSTTDILVGRQGHVRAPEELLQGKVGWLGGKEDALEPYRRLAEQTWPGPYLELFAQSIRLGWDVWGEGIPSSIDLLAGLPRRYLQDTIVQEAMTRIRQARDAWQDAPWEIGDILVDLIKVTRPRYRRSDLWRMAASNMRRCTSHQFPMLMHRIAAIIPRNERNPNKSWNHYRSLYDQFTKENQRLKGEKSERRRRAAYFIDEKFGWLDQPSKPETTDEADPPHADGSAGGASGM